MRAQSISVVQSCLDAKKDVLIHKMGAFRGASGKSSILFTTFPDPISPEKDLHTYSSNFSPRKTLLS